MNNSRFKRSGSLRYRQNVGLTMENPKTKNKKQRKQPLLRQVYYKTQNKVSQCKKSETLLNVCEI